MIVTMISSSLDDQQHLDTPNMTWPPCKLHHHPLVLLSHLSSLYTTHHFPLNVEQRTICTHNPVSLVPKNTVGAKRRMRLTCDQCNYN